LVHGGKAQVVEVPMGSLSEWYEAAAATLRLGPSAMFLDARGLDEELRELDELGTPAAQMRAGLLREVARPDHVIVEVSR
jgi:hypothetical protein